jgi:hypothetical protein
MSTTHLLPQRTLSPLARRLHALLRYCPGYREADDSPRRVVWTLDTLLQLAHRDLPLGCMDAVRELQAASLPQTLTRHLTIDHLCKIIVEVGWYCAYRNVAEEEFSREQARRRRSLAATPKRRKLAAKGEKPCQE